MMKKKSIIIALAIAAIGLLGVSAIGSTQAALTYRSEVYAAQMEVKDIGITLNENGEAVSNRDYTKKDDVWDESTGELLTKMLGEGEQLVLGKHYEERLSVTNTGTIDQYVRVRVYTYWVDDKGSKLDASNNRYNLNPEWIHINLVHSNSQGNKSAWILDEAASTLERDVLYWPTILKKGQTTADFSDYIWIDPAVASCITVTQEVQGSKTIYKYSYDGFKFILEAEADAVQTHNAEDAVFSAWGRDVTVKDGVLSLDAETVMEYDDGSSPVEPPEDNEENTPDDEEEIIPGDEEEIIPGDEEEYIPEEDPEYSGETDPWEEPDRRPEVDPGYVVPVNPGEITE